MATYVSLVSWTEQGVRNFKDTVDRADASEALAKKHGGTVKDLYWTLGPHDIVAILEFPDDESATAFALALSSLGSVRTSSMRAFDRSEMASIVQRASS